MKIGIIAASGIAGGHILREAVMRNHDVTAIVMNKAALKLDVDTIETDLFYLTPEQIQPFDVLINAFSPPLGEAHLHVEAGKHLISLLENSEKKLFVVGSSGCLFIDRNKSIRLLEHDEYPKHLVETAKHQLQNLHDLQNSSIQWSFLSPSVMFDSDGPRTGHYILGKERVLVNSQFNSYISYADFAVAVIDEIENNHFVNKSFTVASENVNSTS
ncbi:NAD(P)-dependent oxidoreductase [Solibacillus sp. FSL H8-0538]|uniref:NAD(P)-dependent oxidoreductase n=1 Tax=Solibacillus sp. FSL H8-0538 TaxID=2921400 RepID=UPI0030F9F5CF